MSLMESSSDIQLLKLLRTGDRHAFSAIYSRYWKKLFTVAANKTGTAEEAEEIVQDIFISLWQRRYSIEITSTLEAYLAVCVKYRVLKVLASRYRYQKYVDYNSRLVSEGNNSTLEWLEFEELKSKLEGLIEKLPEKCRLIYKLSRDQGMSQKQIASKCEISEKTVEAHIGKALRVLRTQFGQIFLLAFLLF